jgi:hypothetical protein
MEPPRGGHPQMGWGWWRGAGRHPNVYHIRRRQDREPQGRAAMESFCPCRQRPGQGATPQRSLRDHGALVRPVQEADLHQPLSRSSEVGRVPLPHLLGHSIRYANPIRQDVGRRDSHRQVNAISPLVGYRKPSGLFGLYVASKALPETEACVQQPGTVRGADGSRLKQKPVSLRLSGITSLRTRFCGSKRARLTYPLWIRHRNLPG